MPNVVSLYCIAGNSKGFPFFTGFFGKKLVALAEKFERFAKIFQPLAGFF